MEARIDRSVIAAQIIIGEIKSNQCPKGSQKIKSKTDDAYTGKYFSRVWLNCVAFYF